MVAEIPVVHIKHIFIDIPIAKELGTWEHQRQCLYQKVSKFGLSSLLWHQGKNKGFGARKFCLRPRRVSSYLLYLLRGAESRIK